MVGHIDAETLDRRVEVEQHGRAASSRTMLCIQKNDARRAPLVTGCTRCRLLAG
jgi:hypothetical protein